MIFSGDDESAVAGMKRSDLVAWYLNEIEDELEDEAELVARKALVEKILDRLIKRVSAELALIFVFIADQAFCFHLGKHSLGTGTG